MDGYRFIFQALFLLSLNGVQSSNVQGISLARSNALEDDDLVKQLMNTKYEDEDNAALAIDSPVEKILQINERYPNQELFQGDIKMHSKDAELITSSGDYMFKRNAVRDRRRLWINKIVPYEITEDLVDHSDDIKAALDDISAVSCINFVEHTEEEHWIKFVQKEGCWSFVGRVFFEPGPQELSLGPDCLETDTIIHEVMHALGFTHEQSRPDRDKFVKIYWENIKEGFEDNFKKYYSDKIDTQEIQYDYQSIMHYGRRMFAKNRRYPTIVAVGDEGKYLGSNRLSEKDIVEINLLYDCKESESGFLSSWSAFGPCDKSCVKSRQRFCHSENPSECPTVDEYGVETHNVDCTVDECKKPIDGHWGRWGSWSACDVSCGRGRRNRTRVCDDPKPQNDGTYCAGSSLQIRLCKARPCHSGPFDCQFEFGFCHWSEESGPSGIYEWHRHRSSTSSHGTGPENDHTYGNERGHYLYAEASSPAEVGDIAVLESREFQPTNERCMSFWYHMLGEHMGYLTVILRDEKTGENIKLWQRAGDQGNEWREANITIKSDDVYRVVFEAARGEGFRGDIAIDDVLFWDGSCFEEPMTTPASVRTTKVPTTLEVKTTKAKTTTKVPISLEVKTTKAKTTKKVPTTSEAKTTKAKTTTKVPTTLEVKTTKAKTTKKVPTTSEVKTTKAKTTKKVPTTSEVKTAKAKTTKKVPTTSEVKTTKAKTTTKVPTTLEVKTTKAKTTTRLETTSKLKTTMATKTTITDGNATTFLPILKTTPAINPITGVQQIGCYRDWGRINGKRPFAYYIDMRPMIKWTNMKESFIKIIQRCRDEVRRQQFEQVFAIQFFGECWFGAKEHNDYERDGRLPMRACFNKIVGRSFSMMVYNIVEE